MVRMVEANNSVRVCIYKCIRVNRPVLRRTVPRFSTYSAFADCQADWREIARLSYS